MITMQTVADMIATSRETYRETARRMRADAETLAAVYTETRDSTPAETVAAYVARIGYERAAACIASIVNRSAWDGRISRSAAAWAQTIDAAADEDAAARMSIDTPSIHRAHLDQIARAMMEMPTPAEALATYHERIRAAETVADVEAVEAEAARDGRITPDAYEAITRRAKSRRALIAYEAEQQTETESAPGAPAVIVPQGYTAAEAVAAITAGPALLHRVAVTVPSTSGPDTPATPETVRFWVSYTMRELSAIFGGCTATPGAGAWIDGDGKLISEAVTVCTSYTDAITAETVRAVREIAEAVRSGMDQDAVTIEIDGAAGFVERPAEQGAED